MKETGIIMSGDHPKKILDGTKTQTRRVIKPQPKYRIEPVSKGWKDYPASFGKTFIAEREKERANKGE